MSNYIDNIVKNAVTYDLVSKPLANDIANEFSIQSTYAVGDYVMHDYKLYKCISAVTTAGNWNSAKWQECKIGDEINGGVKFTAQTLTSEQKAQARNNIGAVSQEEATPDAIRYSAQSLTDAQRNQARVNTGTVASTSIAEEFSTSKAYAVGDMVMYDSKLYKFKTAHSAGAWNVAQVDTVSVNDEISSLSNDLNELKDVEDLADSFEKVPSGETIFDFDTSKMTVGFINTSTGEIVSDSGTGALVSDYLPVEGGQTYFFKGMNRAAFYKANKTFVTSIPAFMGDPYVAPEDGYVRVNAVPERIESARAYVGYKYVADDLVGIDGCLQIEDEVYDFNPANMTMNLIDTTNGNIISDSGTGYMVSDYIPVQSGQPYHFSRINRVAYYSSGKSFIKMVPNTSFGAEVIFPQDGYVRVNSSPANITYSKFIVGKSTAKDNFTRAELNIGSKYITLSGNLSSGQSLQFDQINNIKKNNVYAFFGKITSFSKLKIGHGTSNIYDSYLEIDSENVIIHNIVSSDETITLKHGINISNYIKVEINVKDTWNELQFVNADITILSGNAEFRSNDVKWRGCGKGKIFAQSDGSVLTDCKFTWGCEDLGKKIWIFGDSYVTFPDVCRWPYYMDSDGFLNNVLLNGYGGEKSAESLTNLSGLLSTFCKPKYIVWTLGMNDGSDPSNTYHMDWFMPLAELFGICNQYGIQLILATIPTVPSINHEGKNNWIRQIPAYFGYRYIDFAKAVGASSSGQWYSGMLSSDNVHPSALGAKALYNQLLIDFPEITEQKNEFLPCRYTERNDNQYKRLAIQKYGEPYIGFEHLAFPRMCFFSGKMVIAYRCAHIHMTTGGASAFQLDTLTLGGELKHVKTITASDFQNVQGDCRELTLQPSRDGEYLLAVIRFSTLGNNDVYYGDNVIAVLDSDLNILNYKAFYNCNYGVYGNPLITPNGKLIFSSYDYTLTTSNVHISEEVFSGNVAELTFIKNQITTASESGVTQLSEICLGYFNDTLVAVQRIDDPNGKAVLKYTEDLEGGTGWSNAIVFSDKTLHSPALLPYYNGKYLPFTGSLLVRTNVRYPYFGYIDIDNDTLWDGGVIDYQLLDSVNGYPSFVPLGAEEYAIIYYQDTIAPYTTNIKTAIYFKVINAREYVNKMAYCMW